MATLTTSEQALIKAMDNLVGTYGKLSRAALSVSEVLSNNADQFKKARIEEEVEKAAKAMGKSLNKADGGLLKFVKSLNDQAESYKAIQATLKKFDRTNATHTDQFVVNSKRQMLAAKENGNLQKILGQDYKRNIAFIDEFLAKGEHLPAEIDRMAGIFEVFSKEFSASTASAVKNLENFDREVKKISVKEALGDALSKRGGIAGAITDSLRGPQGIASFLNFLKAQSAEMLIGGVEKAVRQLIDASNTFYKTGVAPFVGASARLLLQMTDLQTIMQANKEAIFAVQGGADAFNDTLIALQTQTMKLAGMDPILSGKLAAAAVDLTTQLASTTLSTKELGKRSQSYITDLTKMRRATNMTAEQIVEMDQQILNDTEIREGMAKATAQERAQLVENIHRRIEEFQVMGISIERSKQLAISFEKLRRQATPVQRIRGAAQLGVLASQIGMSPEDTRQLMLLTRKKRDAVEEKQYEQLQMKFGQQYQKRFNELDQAGSPFADALQEMGGRVQEALPGFKAVFDATRVEGTISGGRAQNPAAQASLDINTNVKEAVVKAGEVASWVEKIYTWLSTNGLAGILMGTLGLLLTGGIGKLVGLLGSVAEGLTKIGGGALGKAGMLGKVGGVLGAGAIGWEVGQLLNEHTGIQGFLADKIDRVTGLSSANADISRTKSFDELPPDQQAQVLAARAHRAGASPSTMTAPTAGGDTAPTSVAATTGTTDPMQSMLILQQQAKKVLEEIAKGINTLVQTYTDTENQKMQKFQTGTNSLGASREMPQ